jgi:hypothetical protein
VVLSIHPLTRFRPEFLWAVSKNQIQPYGKRLKKVLKRALKVILYKAILKCFESCSHFNISVHFLDDFLGGDFPDFLVEEISFDVFVISIVVLKSAMSEILTRVQGTSPILWILVESDLN